MSKINKVISIFLVFAICLSFNMNISAQQASVEGEFSYNLNNGEITISRYNGTDSLVIIPSTISGNPVTTITQSAIVDNKYVKTIVIPKTVTTINDSAFQYCDSLIAIQVDVNNKNYSSKDGILYNKNMTSLIKYPQNKEGVHLPSSLISIEAFAFLECNRITSLNIPDSVTSIGQGSFYRCRNLEQIKLPNSLTKISNILLYDCLSLQELTIPDTVTSIDASAFRASGLTSITLPNNLNELSSDALSDCLSLKAIEISEENQFFSSLDGVLFNKDKTEIFNYPAGKEHNEYTILDTVTQIKANAFMGNVYLSTINIPNTVKNIGESAFQNCSQLNKVSIPEGISSIDYFTFGGCKKLTQIELPDSITSIKWGGFASTGLKTVFIKKGVKVIENHAFSCDTMESIEVDSNNPFYASKEGVLFNKAFTELLSYPCAKNELIYTIPEGVSVINGTAFHYCNNLTTVNMPNSLRNIGDGAFYGCKNIDNVVIPEGVTSLSHAFQMCGKLMRIMLPSSIAVIDSESFRFGGPISISGYPNTYAEHYAKQKGFVFEPIIAKVIISSLVVNGQITKLNAYNINGYTYYKIRDLAMILNKTDKQFNVYWDTLDRSVNITSNYIYTPIGGELIETNFMSCIPNRTISSIYVDGIKTLFTTYTINGYTYFKLRDVAKVIDFSTTWDGKIRIETVLPYKDEKK